MNINNIYLIYSYYHKEILLNYYKCSMIKKNKYIFCNKLKNINNMMFF